MTRGETHPVRVARKAKGWRLVDLADAIDRSAPLLSMIENGYTAKASTRQAIARALDTTVEQLWPEEASNGR